MIDFAKHLLKRRDLGAAHRELLTAVWLMDERTLQAMLDELLVGARVFQSMPDVRDAMALAEERNGAMRAYAVRNGVAHISIAGPIMKDVPCLFHVLGMAATSTSVAIEAIRGAVADPDVSAIMLDVDSPGGTISGTAQLAEAVRAAAATKPVHAHADDLAASAAYWVASQATRFTAFTTAEIGSIGVYTAVVDSSKALEAEGVTVHRIASGEDKGIGMEGAPVTERHLAVLTEQVMGAKDLFVAAVAAGRGMSVEAVEAVATGRCWYADAALELGLIDGVESAEAAHRNVHPEGSHGAGSDTTAPDDGAQDGGPMSKPDSTAVATAENTAAIDELRAKVAELAESNAALKKERDQAQAEAAMLAKKNASAKESRIKAILDAHQARGAFDPADRDDFERQAKAYEEEPEKLDAFLSKHFDSKDNATPKGTTPPASVDGHVDPAELAIGKKLGLDAADLKLAGQVDRISFVKNTITTKDGCELALVEGGAA